jgi:hypothetical protein
MGKDNNVGKRRVNSSLRLLLLSAATSVMISLFLQNQFLCFRIVADLQPIKIYAA